MSSGSSSAAGWSTRLEPAPLLEDVLQRPDDPRLARVIERWRGDRDAVQPGRAVLVGFPQDEGVRRNHGRAGAAAAPCTIRKYLDRLTSWDAVSQVDLATSPPLDFGDLTCDADLETAQQALGNVVAVL